MSKKEKPKKQTTRATKLIAILIGAIAIGAILHEPSKRPSPTADIKPQPKPDATKPEERRIHPMQAETIVIGKKLVTQQMKFPETTEFERVMFHSSKEPVICGRVRAKNNLGQMAPWTRFIASSKTALVEGPDQPIAEAWVEFCLD